MQLLDLCEGAAVDGRRGARRVARARRQGQLHDYGFNAHVAHHYFCRQCGIRPFQWVDIPATGRRYYNVNLACLEGLDIDELMAAPVTHEDGFNDRWDMTPAEIRHL